MRGGQILTGQESESTLYYLTIHEKQNCHHHQVIIVFSVNTHSLYLISHKYISNTFSEMYYYNKTKRWRRCWRRYEIYDLESNIHLKRQCRTEGYSLDLQSNNLINLTSVAQQIGGFQSILWSTQGFNISHSNDLEEWWIFLHRYSLSTKFIWKKFYLPTCSCF